MWKAQRRTDPGQHTDEYTCGNIVLNISREGTGSSEHPLQQAKSLHLGGFSESAFLENNYGFVPDIQVVEDMGFVVHGTELEVPLGDWYSA